MTSRGCERGAATLLVTTRVGSQRWRSALVETWWQVGIKVVISGNFNDIRGINISNEYVSVLGFIDRDNILEL